MPKPKIKVRISLSPCCHNLLRHILIIRILKSGMIDRSKLQLLYTNSKETSCRNLTLSAAVRASSSSLIFVNGTPSWVSGFAKLVVRLCKESPWQKFYIWKSEYDFTPSTNIIQVGLPSRIFNDVLVINPLCVWKGVEFYR